jgi:hypothetical protein
MCVTMTVGHRGTFAFDRMSEGWTQTTAVLVARVLHPFDDNDQPSRRLRKKVTRRSREFARLGAMPEWRSLTLAYGVALDYWKYATADGDIGLAHRWKQLCAELQAAYRQRPGGRP